MGSRRATLGALALAAGLACERAPLTTSPVDAARGRADRAEAAIEGATPHERVFFPRGACSTGWIQVQRYERGRGWIAHPEHPRIRADTVHEEEARSLLDLRVRCFDPADRLPPSEWVRGVSLQGLKAGQGAQARPGSPPGLRPETGAEASRSDSP